MATQDELHTAEARMRDLLDDAGLPQPDEVEYRADEIVCLWHERKTAVVVELTPDAATGALFP